MNDKDIFYIQKKIINHLSTLPNFKKVHEDEYVINCINCEKDSNKKHGHLYINFQLNGVMLANCFKCPTSLRVDNDFLQKLGIFDPEILNFNKSLFKNRIGIKFNNSYTSPIMRSKEINKSYILPKFVDQKHDFKRLYFEKRTGIKLNQNIIQNYNLIFSLYEFLNINNINLNNYDNNTKFLINELDKNFIGFLSTNKSMIMFRSATKFTNFSRNKMNFVIDPNYKLSFYYTPGINKVDLMTEKPKIIMAEGPYDIICIKEKFFTKSNSDTIFVAVGGKNNYKKILREIIHRTGFLNAEVTIFSDEDVKIDEYINKVLGSYTDILHGRIIYNELSKDFGSIDIPYKFKIYKF